MAASAKHHRSLRLWFRFDGDRVELIRVEPVEMRALPSVGEAPRAGRHAGTWIELRDDGGQSISVHLVAGNPFRRVTERIVDGELRATIDVRRSGSFDVVVPDSQGARSAALFSSRDRMAARSVAAATLVGRFELRTKPASEESP